jgi:hypothetical protein
LSISAYHEESWQPAWGVRTMLEAIISFLPSEGAGAIGALDWTAEERKKLAKQSLLYHCPTCGPIKNLLKEASEMTEGDSKLDSSMAEQVAQLHLGPPAASSTSPKYNSSAVPNELLMASAAAQMSSSLGENGPDNGLGHGHGPADQQNHLHSPMTTEGAHLLDHHSPKALVTEDAVDNFDHLQQIDKIHSSLKKNSPSSSSSSARSGGGGGETSTVAAGTGKEVRDEKEGTELTNEKNNNKNNSSSPKTTEPTTDSISNINSSNINNSNNNSDSSSNDLKKEGNTIPTENSVPNTTPATTTVPPPSLSINPPTATSTTSNTPASTQPNNNNNTINNNNNSNPPLAAPLGAAIAAAAAAQQQEARAAVVVDRLRRTEEFLSTMILVTMVGIFAILAKVVMRNILKFDH